MLPYKDKKLIQGICKELDFALMLSGRVDHFCTIKNSSVNHKRHCCQCFFCVEKKSVYRRGMFYCLWELMHVIWWTMQSRCVDKTSLWSYRSYFIGFVLFFVLLWVIIPGMHRVHAVDVTPLYGSQGESFEMGCDSEIMFVASWATDIEIDDTWDIRDLVVDPTWQTDISTNRIVLKGTGEVQGRLRFVPQLSWTFSLVFIQWWERVTHDIMVAQDDGICGRDIVPPRIQRNATGATLGMMPKISLDEYVVFEVSDNVTTLTEQDIDVVVSGAQASWYMHNDLVMVGFDDITYDQIIDVTVTATDGYNTQTQDFVVETRHSPAYCAMQWCPWSNDIITITQEQCRLFDPVRDHAQQELLQDRWCVVSIAAPTPTYKRLAVIGRWLFALALLMKIAYITRIRSLKKYLWIKHF